MDQVKLGKCVRNYAHNALFGLNQALFGTIKQSQKTVKNGHNAIYSSCNSVHMWQTPPKTVVCLGYFLELEY